MIVTGVFSSWAATSMNWSFSRSSSISSVTSLATSTAPMISPFSSPDGGSARSNVDVPSGALVGGLPAPAGPSAQPAPAPAAAPRRRLACRRGVSVPEERGTPPAHASPLLALAQPKDTDSGVVDEGDAPRGSQAKTPSTMLSRTPCSCARPASARARSESCLLRQPPQFPVLGLQLLVLGLQLLRTKPATGRRSPSTPPWPCALP